MLELALVVNYSIAIVASAIIREDELLSIDSVHRIGSLPWCRCRLSLIKELLHLLFYIHHFLAVKLLTLFELLPLLELIEILNHIILMSLYILLLLLWTHLHSSWILSSIWVLEITILYVLAQILSWHTTHFIIGETSCSIFVLLLSITLFLVHHTIQTHLVLISHETHIRHLSLIVALIIGILHLVLLIVILLLLLSSLRCLLAIALSIRLIIHWVLWVLSNG